MLAKTKAFSSFAVNDASRARAFYGETLGIDVAVLDEKGGLMSPLLAGAKS